MMNHKPEYLVELIYRKLKNYKPKKIHLEKEILEKFIFELFNEN